MFEISRRLLGATLLGRLLRLPLKLLPSGLMVSVHSGNDRGMKWEAGASTCWHGFYEKDKQELIPRLVIPGMRASDIGANLGFLHGGLVATHRLPRYGFGFRVLGSENWHSFRRR